MMDLKNKVGKKITLEGKISDIPWQHIIKSVITHKHIYYFDLKDETQIVIYAKNGIDCRNNLVIEGEIIEVKAPSKRPSKIDDITYVEYHMLVDKWICSK